MTNIDDVINQKIDKYADAMEALAKGEEMSELKPCPFCGSEAEESFMGGGNVACGNSDCEAGMLMMYPRFWNMRPIEDALRAQLAERDALIERLVERGNDIKDFGGFEGWNKWQALVAEYRAMKGGER